MSAGLNIEDTIAAIATASGNGAIGIIRVSGPDSFKILQQIFVPLKQGVKTTALKAAKLTLGDVVVAEKKVDQALAVVFPAPKSYSGQDMFELYAHGGFLLLNLILKHILSLGSRLAEPGEFTKRAFLNGKIDLSRAEAVNEIIAAPSLAAAAALDRQLNGKLHLAMLELKEKLKTILALLNADMDFSDEDIAFYDSKKLVADLTKIDKKLKNILATARESIILHHGASVSIGGRVNVGKSSLLNALLGEQKAIVTDIPGTTRDIIAGYLLIDDLKIEILDTAGIRKTKDPVEKIGVTGSVKALNQADVVLWVIDLSCPDYRLPSEVLPDKILLIGNKLDLIGKGDQALELPAQLKNFPWVKISAQKSQGLSELKSELKKKLFTDSKKPVLENAVIFNTRQQNLLSRAQKFTATALQQLKKETTPDMVAFELSEAIGAVSAIVGEVTSEDLLDDIFSKFCIGK